MCVCDNKTSYHPLSLFGALQTSVTPLTGGRFEEGGQSERTGRLVGEHRYGGSAAERAGRRRGLPYTARGWGAANFHDTIAERISPLFAYYLYQMCSLVCVCVCVLFRAGYRHWSCSTERVCEPANPRCVCNPSCRSAHICLRVEPLVG